MKISSLILATVFAFSPVLYAKKKGPRHGGHHKRMLEKIDGNKDQKISKAEWVAHHEKRFSEIDKNKDGFLTKDEFKAHRKAMRKKHREMRKKGCKHCKMHKGPNDDGPEDEG